MTGIKNIVICGGVAANSMLRREAISQGNTKGIHVYVPTKKHCTDNAVMIAMAAQKRFSLGEKSRLNLCIKPNSKI